MNKHRAIAIYLPQFHPVPENDLWWGRGFTEWRNVIKATPRFKGHYQPHLPTDLGFYDLRLHNIMEQQAELAREHGIYGFMFYHYWFNGRRILETPVNNILKNRTPDFPFILCWANENWTRSWDGRSGEILLRQDYSAEDDSNHIQYLCREVFSDHRYICIDGKPVFAVYRTELFPNIRKTSELWRKTAKDYGFSDIYLVRIESFASDIAPSEVGFDASVEFQPDWHNLPKRMMPALTQKILGKLCGISNALLTNHVYSYSELVNKSLLKEIPHYKRFPTVVPMWDNSARREKDAYIFHNSTPEQFDIWIEAICNKFNPYSDQENFIIINAWNEWAEGCHLEPCFKWGKNYLEVVKKYFK